MEMETVLESSGANVSTGSTGLLATCAKTISTVLLAIKVRHIRYFRSLIYFSACNNVTTCNGNGGCNELGVCACYDGYENVNGQCLGMRY